jgi:hypothetical protein
LIDFNFLPKSLKIFLREGDILMNSFKFIPSQYWLLIYRFFSIPTLTIVKHVKSDSLGSVK